MRTLHPNILECDGRKAFAVLPFDEFERMKEDLKEYEDLKDLREAKAEEANAPVTPLSTVRKQLGI